MSNAPEIVDPIALRLHRDRATLDRSDFIHQTVSDIFKERLEEINKTFTDRITVTAAPSFWGANSVHSPGALETKSSDLILNPLTLHWANDPVGDLVRCRHALKEDGLYLGCMLGGETLHQLRRVLLQAETEIYGGATPRVLPMAHIADAGALLQRAGFALPVADNLTLNVSYPNFFALAADLRAMGETNALTARTKRFTRRSMMLRAAKLYTEQFGDADDRIPATFDLIFLTGWAPSDSQQKPLRPGSAKVRLSDVLNIPLGQKGTDD